MERILSNQGLSLILRGGLTYRLVNKLKTTEEERWRCTVSACSATIYTLEDGNLLSRSGGEHSHAGLSEEKVNVKKISNSVKRKAVECIDERPAKLINSELLLHKSAINTLTRKDVSKIRKNINNARLKRFPKLPTSAEEVHLAIENFEINSITKENMLLRNEKDKGIVVFACEENLNHLPCSETILMDGTFEYVPKYFNQMFTVHGYINGVYIPLVFCLLRNKKTQTSNALKIISEECSKRSLPLQPKHVVMDFENSIHIAVAAEFPRAVIIGCRFHLGQAWWRKIQKLGLATTYQDSASEKGRWLKYCFGMSYLKPGNVEEIFCELVSIQPPDDKLSAFADYLLETYVDPETAIFPPQIWACDKAHLWRTTNACESFHARFNGACPSNHPNIFVFLSTLVQTQTDIYIRMNSARQGQVVKSDKKTREKVLFIEKKLEQLKAKEISELTFVKCIGFKVSA